MATTAARSDPRDEPSAPRAAARTGGGTPGQRFLDAEATTGRDWRFADRPETDDPRRVDTYDAPVYVISVAAEMAEMHPQTLRTYEREGLVHPMRTEGNTRRYSRRDVDRLKFIRHLTQERGLNLAGVRVVLEMGEQLDGARRRIAELEEVVRALASRVDDSGGNGERRFEIIPSPGRAVQPHQRGRRYGSGQPTARKL